jgi:hypothetical protein
MTNDQKKSPAKARDLVNNFTWLNRALIFQNAFGKDHYFIV